MVISNLNVLLVNRAKKKIKKRATTLPQRESFLWENFITECTIDYDTIIINATVKKNTYTTNKIGKQ